MADAPRIHGEQIPVRARVATLDGLSAHADREGIIRWLSGFERAPRQVFIVHGEPRAAQGLAEAISASLGWSASVARDGQVASLET